MKKPLFSWSNISTTLVIIFVVLMLFVPDFKALIIRGLMQVGLFQPDVSKKQDNLGRAYEFSNVVFQNSDGKVVSLQDLKGKVVFINFWATWCPPCIAEMPSINVLYNKLKNNKRVVFIMVDADSNLSKSQQFMQKHGLDMPLYQAINSVPKKLFAGALPTTVIIDKQGQVVYRHEGGADYSNPEVLSYMNTLLNK